MLTRKYTDITVLSIAANGRDMSFSADTGMAECLVIARKLKPDEPPYDRTHFTSLRHRPQGFVDADATFKGIDTGNHVRRVEDGPYGGTPLNIGSSLAGETITAHATQAGETGARCAWPTIPWLKPPMPCPNPGCGFPAADPQLS